MIRWLIAAGVRRARKTGYILNVVNYENHVHFKRFCFWRMDSYRSSRQHHFNMFLHRWNPCVDDTMHDHRRWSITICLQGYAIEHTPWGSKHLHPGSIVIRSHKAIHKVEVPSYCWTLFIVGKRQHKQHWYAVEEFL